MNKLAISKVLTYLLCSSYYIVVFSSISELVYPVSWSINFRFRASPWGNVNSWVIEIQKTLLSCGWNLLNWIEPRTDWTIPYHRECKVNNCNWWKIIGNLEMIKGNQCKASQHWLIQCTEVFARPCNRERLILFWSSPIKSNQEFVYKSNTLGPIRLKIVEVWQSLSFGVTENKHTVLILKITRGKTWLFFQHVLTWKTATVSVSVLRQKLKTTISWNHVA